MKILNIRSTQSIGGTEIYNLNLINAMSRFGIKNKIFYLTTSKEFSSRIKDLGTKVITIDVFKEEVGTKKGLLRLFFSLPRYLYGYLSEIIKLRNDFDLICIQSATEKIVLSPILYLLGYKIMWLEHGPIFSFPKAKEVMFLYKLMSIFANKVICVSPCTLEDEVVGGIDRRKLICVPTGINTNYYSPINKRSTRLIKQKLGIKAHEKIVGFVGRICEEKGIRFFLSVTIEICKKNSNCKILVVGDGPLFKEAMKITKKCGLSNKFIFTGFVKDVRPFLGIFDVLFSATTYESLSMTLMQAMSMGVPVVTRNIWDNKELIVHEKTGLLFNNESVKDLSSVIISLINNRVLRKTMSVKSRDRIIKHFNEKDWIKSLNYEVSNYL